MTNQLTNLEVYAQHQQTINLYHTHPLYQTYVLHCFHENLEFFFTSWNSTAHCVTGRSMCVESTVGAKQNECNSFNNHSWFLYYFQFVVLKKKENFQHFLTLVAESLGLHNSPASLSRYHALFNHMHPTISSDKLLAEYVSGKFRFLNPKCLFLISSSNVKRQMDKRLLVVYLLQADALDLLVYRCLTCNLILRFVCCFQNKLIFFKLCLCLCLCSRRQHYDLHWNILILRVFTKHVLLEHL